MSTTTPNLGLTKPAPGGDDDAWAPMLNGNADILDTQVQVALTAAAAALTNAASANSNANTRLLASLVSSFALTLLDDTSASTARATLGALASTAISSFGLTLVDDTSAAAARATLGAPALPQGVGGAGQWVSLQPGNNGPLTIPGGGTWAWWVMLVNVNLGVAGFNAGVSAGGTQVIPAPGVGNQLLAVAWRFV
ncbi:MAG TPA: hypothetical protein VGM87_13925 [Roseomonas sp.]|jgi:hypothetical protein